MGKVYLVGAGPGDISLLTIKARDIITQAEVLIYDALVDEELLNLVPENCLKIDVGKRGGEVSTPQAEINRLLVKYCQEGYQVVRVKSGDPFIFGRITSELDSLIENGCDYSVIPGLSSALTAPLLAGIPLTDPVLSRGFAVVTAHEIDALNWDALVQLETLVILMGGRNLAEIIHHMIRRGKSPKTPIAIIQWASTKKQVIWTGTLDNILRKTAHHQLAPAVIVTGEVVRLSEYFKPQLV